MRNSFNDLILLAVKGKNKTLEVNIPLEIDGKTWRAYEVSISYRDLLFTCEEGIVTYLVDSYGERHTAELYDWESNQ